jgi:tRNA A-37 threonylcarbamoyl transferase component Bud32
VNALEGGHAVGRYRIVKFLGAGAMGEVYLAEDPQIDRRLAIKTVRLAGRPQEIEERKRRLLREARAAGRLLHPNVVTLFDAGEAEGLLYLAFEFVEGTDLAARLEDGGDRLSLRQVLRVVRQAADALDYAHGHEIVHRDIKPSNILLDRAGRVKLADFGIARMAGQSTELTMAGSVMGSPQYLSPEQIRGEELDGRSDIFSLGVVLYELLSGKRPFEGDTITTLVYQILHKEPPPVSELRAVPPRLEELLRRMLAKDRDERPTAGEAGRELAAIEAELSDETLSAPAGTGPLDATRVLPRKTGDAGPLGTVPAAPPTTPSQPPRVPTAAAPAQPVQPAPVPAAAVLGAAAPPKRLPIGLLLGLLLLVMAGAGAAGWYVFLRPTPTPQEITVQTSAEPAAPVPAASSPVTPPEAPATQPAALPVSTIPSTSASPSQVRPEPPAVTAPRTAPPQPQPVPPSQQRPVPPSAAEPARPSPAPAEPEAAPQREEPAAPEADRTLRTALEVTFNVTPPDAIVLVDRTVIGEAQSWSGGRGTRTYVFPGPGTYLVKFRKQGMKDYRIAVEAGALSGKTPITARLQPVAAADADAADLETVRVREAIAFRVQPVTATLEVDGQAMGQARRFSGGGFLRAKGEWLELAPGKHRVSIAAPGYQRQDLTVVVVATAEDARRRVDVALTPGGDR